MKMKKIPNKTSMHRSPTYMLGRASWMGESDRYDDGDKKGRRNINWVHPDRNEISALWCTDFTATCHIRVDGAQHSTISPLCNPPKTIGA